MLNETDRAKGYVSGAENYYVKTDATSNDVQRMEVTFTNIQHINMFTLTVCNDVRTYHYKCVRSLNNNCL